MQADLKMEVVDTCPVCGGTELAPVFTKAHMGVTLYFSQCRSCQTVFLNPRMTNAQTEVYYAEVYRQATTPTQESREFDRKVQQARAFIQLHFYEEQTKQFPAAVHSHLEIGSSAGFLLKAIHSQLKVDVSVGVEPNDLYQDEAPANEFRVFKKLSQVPKQPFDLISMSHSLEHVNQPLGLLHNLIDNYSNEHTRFLVEVPDLEHNAHDALLFHHPVAYDINTLRGLFVRVGCDLRAAGYHGLGSPFKFYLLALFERGLL